MRISFLPAAALLSASLFMVSCEQEAIVEQVEVDTPAARFMDFPAAKQGATLGKSANGQQYAVVMAEYITDSESGQLGTTIFFNNRGNKQLSNDFVPGLQLDGTDAVSYYVDETRPSDDVPVGVSTAAIVRSMQTWDDVQCSDLDMYRVPSDGRPTGYIAAVLGYPGSFDYVADIVQAGWLPREFFDFLAPNGSASILGVTFTINFFDENGEVADSNNDGKGDVAWREIYYNDRFRWSDGGAPGIDIETVSLHEAGHGLSQAHFGKGFRTLANGKLHFAPQAVMNATYFEIQTEIDGSDKGGHCSIWANWPNN